MKLLFLFRLLCSETFSIYRQLAVKKLTDCIYGNDRYMIRFKMVSPIMSMYYAAQKYGICEKIRECIDLNNFGSYVTWKGIIKKRIWEYEHACWRASCVMYRNLGIYSDCVTRIEMNIWWKLVKLKPNLVKKAACAIAVLCGGQPVNMQANFNSAFCQLCDLRQREDALHILFVCPELGHTRSVFAGRLADKMPDAMKYVYDNFDIEMKLSFLLSGMSQNVLTIEWLDTYVNILNLIYSMYKKRKLLYDVIDM